MLTSSKIFKKLYFFISLSKRKQSCNYFLLQREINLIYFLIEPLAKISFAGILQVALWTTDWDYNMFILISLRDRPAAVNFLLMKINGDCLLGNIPELAARKERGVERKFSGIGAEENHAVFPKGA